ncbi:hypothetical protein OS493_035438 [Desmophyllum pertusum]|uniref:Uncharacterized protein n=1 Tax=Desmophyllum pertusum TaxID=174260 RepID=A0A9X0D082_9CNID|nr:hypothetical protein OS493_035438 [Desmophyllum pertusum]
MSFFTFLRFGTAASVTGFFVCHYVYILELVGPSYRTMGAKVMDFFWVTGAAVMALLAYFIRDWRTLLLVASFPRFCFFLLWTSSSLVIECKPHITYTLESTDEISLASLYGSVRVLPESARWLVVNGQVEKAYNVLKNFAEKSAVSIDSESLKDSLAKCYHGEAESEANKIRHKPLDLLRTPRMRKRTLILWFNW